MAMRDPYTGMYDEPNERGQYVAPTRTYKRPYIPYTTTRTAQAPLTAEQKKAWWASRTPEQKAEWLAKKNGGK